MPEYFLDSTTNQKDADQIKTEPDEKQGRCKIIDLFDLRHDLGDTKEHPNTGNQQCRSPDNLKWRFSSHYADTPNFNKLQE